MRCGNPGLVCFQCCINQVRGYRDYEQYQGKNQSNDVQEDKQ